MSALPAPSSPIPGHPPAVRFCGQCGAGLALITLQEDGGPKARLRCPACGWTHWNNPVPVLAAVVECVDREGRLLLARNAAWPGRMFRLITGFMEAGETPQQGIFREVAEETSLVAESAALIGVYDFQRQNQLIVAYHVRARGEIRLSPELAEYRLFAPEEVRCWDSSTGHALAEWLRSRGHVPLFLGQTPAAS